MKPARRIALMGGTFNPVHLGHLFAAERVREIEKLDRVILVPSRTPPHRKGAALAPADDRLAMAKAAVEGNPAFEVSDAELRRRGPSYTVDTLRHFRDLLPEQTRLFFVLGFDAALELDTWRDLSGVLDLAELLVVSRPGIEWNRKVHARWTNVMRAAGPRGARRIRIVPIASLPISATEIRERVRHGLSLRYLVPDAVVRHLVRRKLYR